MVTRVDKSWRRERRWNMELCPHCKRRVPVYHYHKPGGTMFVAGCSRRCANRYLDSLEKPVDRTVRCPA